MKNGQKLLTKTCSNWTRGSGFKVGKDSFSLDTREKMFKANRTTEQVAQGSGQGPILGGIQGQV